MPFKSVVNEYYAKDISKKIRSAFVVKAQNGEFTGSKPPYGYQRDPNSKNRLIPDDVTAEYARIIFRMIVNGSSPHAVSKYLRENKVLKPRCYDDLKEKRRCIGDMKNPYKWHESSIVKIVKNPVYLGHMINHKNVTRSYKIKKRINIPEDQQIIVENTHEPLVDASTFEITTKMVKVKKKKDKNGITHIFTGLLKCDKCGKSMVYTNPKSTKNPYSFYACSNAKRNGKEACTYHHTRYENLYEVVLQEIQKQVALANIGEKEFLQYLTKANQQRESSKVKRMTKEKAKYSKRVTELDRIIKRLYEDNVLGKITDDRFMILTKDYEKEQSEIKETLEYLEDQLNEIEIQNLNSYQFTKLIKRYTEVTELTALLLKELVDKIVIHQSEKVNGKRMQQIDIYYRFIGTL